MRAVYITPFFTENALIFLHHLSRIEDAQLFLVSQEPWEALPESLCRRLGGHWQVQNCLSAEQLRWAVEGLSKKHGRMERLLAANEQIQVQVAQVREWLGIAGMDAATALRFRDKNLMKETFRAAGVACARSCAVTEESQAWAFVEQVGYPLCVKPVDGAATQSTFRVENAESLRDVLRASGPCPERPLQIEEFIVAEEHSFETVMLGGEPIWHSLTHYIPGPLEVVRNPWIQYQVILPREIDTAKYDDIRASGVHALKALGMQNGLSHMEWFRRKDGSVAINEVAARPPGVQIMPLINRAHDVDFFTAWGRLMIFDEFDPPKERKYAAGCAFLRGLGEGRVAGVHGLEDVLRDLSHLVTDVKIPRAGDPKAISYEGEGYVIVRHPETRVVAEALHEVVSRVRVVLME
jgi:biotin carboxylase